MKHIFIFILALVCGSANAANWFVRQGAGGSGTGADWTNAYTDLPTSLTRGDTYYVADGSYGGHAFTDAASGTSTITIKKCTTSDGVSSAAAGYVSTYCDGKATFTGTFSFTRPYYVIDGVTRNESNWKDHATYGFSIRNFRASRLDGGHVGSDCSADNITVRYTHVGTSGTTFATFYDGEGFYIAGFGDSGTITCDNWTVHRALVQNIVVGIQCAGCTGLTVEYSYFYIGWGKEAIRGQLDAKNMTVRYNVFEDSCMTRPATSDRCTAEIAAWGYAPLGNYDNFKIYGNVFFKTANFLGENADVRNNSQGVILIGGDGVNQSGDDVPARNALLYNNTIAGHLNAGNFILGGSSPTGNVCRNNAWFSDAGAGIAGACTSSANVTLTGTPFVNYAAGNFRLSEATTAGTSIASPYNLDMDGVTRGADGVWDVGAFEFSAGGGSAPNAPSNLRLLDIGSLLFGLALLGSFLWRCKHGNRSRSAQGRSYWGLGDVGRQEVCRVAGR